MDFSLPAGSMRDRLAIYQRSASTDSIGDPVNTWTSVGTRWGRIEAVSNANLEVAKGFAGTVTHQCKLRYFTSVNNDCHLIADGLTYAIDGVVHDPRRVWTILFLTLSQA